MKKIGLLSLVLVLALAGMGAAYAHWDQTLFIVAQAETGDINFGMHLAPNSIGAVYLGNPTSPPPSMGGLDDGIWDSAGQDDPDYDACLGPICCGSPSQPETACVAGGVWGLLDKDFGSTTVTTSNDAGPYTSNLDGSAYTLSKSMTIVVSNCYPKYVTGVSFCVANSGSVPIELTGLKAIGVPPELEVVMLDYPVDPLPGGQGSVSGYDWGITFLTDNNNFPIPEGNRWQLDAGESWLTGLGIACRQSAAQGATYSFTIELTAQQWNAD